MILPGLVDSHIPHGSFFDINQYKDILNKIDYGDLLFPFVLFGNLIGLQNINDQLLDQVKGKKINIKNDTYLLVSQLPEDIWSNLPIRSHELITPTEEQEQELNLALQYLSENYPSGYKLFSEFARAIAWVSLKDEFKEKDSQITSSSFPILPLCVFISDKAQYHIPPNSISKESSYRFLAENLYHEAVHQAVNMNLLMHEVFIEDYNSQESPKVEIPWRYNQVKRNQFWELDRTFHATIVYSQMIRYRLAQLNNSDLKPFERLAFEEATTTGMEAAKYLSQSLLNNEQYFTKKGVELIQELASNIKTVSQSVSEVRTYK
ncbi:hypothetical protein [Brevibacillus daliensis]|uniref:hypothetical protein n=1 Tax=Brevibacillus daliensis TaxID=2892995 RepID=UPI001E2D0482|nr:hypothetical protein [Brevibacillus daliensis]